MNDKEWIENIQNISNEELFNQLEFIGCDGYYSDLWVAIIEELKRRTKQQDNSGDLISREALKKAIAEFHQEENERLHTPLWGSIGLNALDRLINNAPTVLTIPNNPTNGDMIKALFPYIEPKFYKNMSDMHTVYIKIDDKVYGDMYNTHTFSTDWWNAPYKEADNG